MRNAQIIVLAGADTATITGSAIDAGQIIAASFVPAFGDVTAAGTIKIQASNDNPTATGGRIPQNFVPTNWADIPNATSVVAAGVGPAIVIGSMAFSYIRAVYTRTSGGSTTISVAMNSLSA